MTQITDEMIAKNKVERFVSRFEPSYHLLACHAALPLVLTPELVNYLRVQFLKSEGVPWIAEADLLLSDLCRPVGYELYVMDEAVKVYLLKQLEQDQQFGKARIKEIANLLLSYVKHLAKTNPFLGIKELETQKWGAMLYINTEQTVKEIARAISESVEPAEIARLLKIAESFKQQIASSGQFQSFLDYAQISSDLLRKPQEIPQGLIKKFYQVADLELTIPAILNKIDYTQLENLLISQQWKKANEETQRLMLSIMGREKSELLNREDLNNFPIKEIQKIDRLWVKASNSHFGFSIQKEIWLKETDGQIDIRTEQELGDILGWRVNGKWKSNSQLTFAQNAPRGHLPTYQRKWFSVRDFLARISSIDFVRFDALKTCTFEVATIEIEETHTFEFTIASLQRQSDQAKGKQSAWVINHQQSSSEGIVEVIGEGIELELMEIPAGTFWMGAPEGELESQDDERPQHKVTVPSFYMGRYQVTQAQWKAIAERTDLKVNIDLKPDPSTFKEDPPLEKGEKPKTRWDRPVEQVTWEQAKEFCDRLSQLTEQQYRLPTEAEWEYACRSVINEQSSGVREELTLAAWNQTYNQPFHFGETISTELANYDGDYTYGDGVKGKCRNQTTPVGYFQVANAFGLYDMHGNVFEWCEDDYHDSYKGAPIDGSAWIDNDNRSFNTTKILRGGSWYIIPHGCRSAIRDGYSRDHFINYVGVRVVRSSPRTS